MKNIKLYIILVLSIGVLIACNNENNDSNSDSNIDDEAIVIKVAYKDDGPSDEHSVKYYDELSKRLKEDKDIDIEFDLVELAQGDYSEKLGLHLNGGDIPDLIYFQGGDENFANQDILEDLTPYIEESEYIKDILQPHNEARLENYPYLLWIKPADNKVPVIRTDWFDELETADSLISNPTPDNYKKLFEELLNNDYVDYPITVAGDISELDFIFNMAFGIDKTWLETKNGYVFSKVSDLEKEKIAFYQELYEEGLLDSEYPTKKWDTKEDAFYNGEAAVIVGTNGKVIDFYNSRMKEVNDDESAELTVLPPAKGEYQGYGSFDITKESRGLAISALSDHKELVFEILDYLASPDGQMLDRLGFEDEHYEVVNDSIELTNQYYADWNARYWEPLETSFNLSISEDTPILSKPALESQKQVNEYYTEDNSILIPEDYVARWDAMENLYKEYMVDIITGKLPIDAFDEFVEEWYEAGGKDLTDLANDKLE